MAARRASAAVRELDEAAPPVSALTVSDGARGPGRAGQGPDFSLAVGPESSPRSSHQETP
jgi:hypothetical protein